MVEKLTCTAPTPIEISEMETSTGNKPEVRPCPWRDGKTCNATEDIIQKAAINLVGGKIAGLELPFGCRWKYHSIKPILIAKGSKGQAWVRPSGFYTEVISIKHS